jgi:O-antigen/teichoic acid export membrane protein
MRTKKALKNMSTSLIYQVIAIISGLITPRLLLSSFGSTYNGVVSSATQFLSMTNLLTLGITASTRVALYKAFADKDVLAVSRLVKATEKYMQKVAFCMVVFSVLLCFVYPFISHNDLSTIENASLILIVSIGSFAEFFFGITNMTLLQADQASYVTNIVNIVKIIMNTVCVALLISLGASIYIVKLGSSIVFFIAPALLNVYIKKKYKLIKECEPDNSGINQRKAVAFHSIANIIHNNTDLMVLTLFVDAKVISVYTVYYLVIGKIKTLMQVFTSGMEAAFGDMWVKKEYKTLEVSFSGYEYMLYCFAGIVFSCVGALIIPFVKLYTRGVTDVNYVLPMFAILVTITEAVYCIRDPYLTLVYATGSFEETKKGAMWEAIINIIISVACVSFVGIYGVIIGTLVANIYRTVQFAQYISKNILNRSFGVVVRRVIWLISCSLISLSVYYCTMELINLSLIGWGIWVIKAIICFSICVIIVLVMSVLFYRNDFKYLMTLVKRVFGVRYH